MPVLYRSDDIVIDTVDGGQTIRKRQDVSAVLERNRIGRNDTDGYSPARTFRSVAEIPVEIIEAWAQIDGIDWWQLSAADQAAYLKRKVSDPDWKGLRNSPGRV